MLKTYDRPSDWIRPQAHREIRWKFITFNVIIDGKDYWRVRPKELFTVKRGDRD